MSRRPGWRGPPPAAHSGALARALAAMLLIALASCTPLYFPPLPSDALVPEARLRLAGSSTLVPTAAEDPFLRLRLDVAEVPDDGWLAVQWFGPSGGEVASASIWLTRSDAGGTHLLHPPADVAHRAGEWRALVSWYGQVVRQFRTELPAR
ncbi:MAG: hypothetical protein H0U69_04960 [Trueperaceae bacterium]|nr:hypothetical protein [Trueperaceae bacterium]